MFRWLKKMRESRRAHARAWEGRLYGGDDEPTEFQALLVSDIKALLEASEHPMTVELINVSGPGFGPSYHLSITSGEIDIWIHDDTFCVDGPGPALRLEHWDADTPEEARRAVSETVQANLAALAVGNEE